MKLIFLLPIFLASSCGIQSHQKHGDDIVCSSRHAKMGTDKEYYDYTEREYWLKNIGNDRYEFYFKDARKEYNPLSCAVSPALINCDQDNENGFSKFTLERITGEYRLHSGVLNESGIVFSMSTEKGICSKISGRAI